MKQHCIKITATLLIPYDPDTRGDTGRAEDLEVALLDDLTGRATVDRWQAKKTVVREDAT